MSKIITYKVGLIHKKILLMLLAMTSIALTMSRRKQLTIAKEVLSELDSVRPDSISRAIENLYKSNLVNRKVNLDGTTTLVLTKKGREIALTYNLDTLTIDESKKWDGKWRLIMFDIPEKHKKARDAFRFHLKRMGFVEYQKSAFMTPYKCNAEIDCLREDLGIKPFVRVLIVSSCDNELHLKKHFGLT